MPSAAAARRDFLSHAIVYCAIAYDTIAYYAIVYCAIAYNSIAYSEAGCRQAGRRVCGYARARVRGRAEVNVGLGSGTRALIARGGGAALCGLESEEPVLFCQTNRMPWERGFLLDTWANDGESRPPGVWSLPFLSALSACSAISAAGILPSDIAGRKRAVEHGRTRCFGRSGGCCGAGTEKSPCVGPSSPRKSGQEIGTGIHS